MRRGIFALALFGVAMGGVSTANAQLEPAYDPVTASSVTPTAVVLNWVVGPGFVHVFRQEVATVDDTCPPSVAERYNTLVPMTEGYTNFHVAADRLTQGTTTYTDTAVELGTVYCYRIVSSSGFEHSMPLTVRVPGHPPVAMADATPTTPAEGAEVMLASTGSTAGDTATEINSYTWTQVTSANGNIAVSTTHADFVTLRGANSATATFTVPERFQDGEQMLHFRLRVADDDGMDDAHVTVTATGDDDAPMVRIRAPGQAAPETEVTLSIRATDVDNFANAETGQSPFAYAWDCAVANVEGAIFTEPTISPSAPTPVRSSEANVFLSESTFTAPMLADAAGNSAPQLTVNCELTATSGSGPGGIGGLSAMARVAILISNASGDIVNKAVLPEILRQIPDGVNRSIYARIVERQKADGQWK